VMDAPLHYTIHAITVTRLLRSRPVTGVDHARHVEIEVRRRRRKEWAPRLLLRLRPHRCPSWEGRGAGVIPQDEITEVIRFRNHSKADLILWLIRIRLTEYNRRLRYAAGGGRRTGQRIGCPCASSTHGMLSRVCPALPGRPEPGHVRPRYPHHRRTGACDRWIAFSRLLNRRHSKE
jgi:hypothetical protein